MFIFLFKKLRNPGAASGVPNGLFEYTEYTNLGKPNIFMNFQGQTILVVTHVAV